MQTNRLFISAAFTSILGLLGSACATKALADPVCAVTIDATQDMKFSVTSFDVPKSCAKFTVSLNNTSSYGKEVMAHNLVITKSSDRQAVSNAEGVNEASNYLKPNDERVVAATNLIGGGEKASVTFDVSKLDAGSDYVYFCSYPGHAMRLRGIIKVI